MENKKGYILDECNKAIRVSMLARAIVLLANMVPMLEILEKAKAEAELNRKIRKAGIGIEKKKAKSLVLTLEDGKGIWERAVKNGAVDDYEI